MSFTTAMKTSLNKVSPHVPAILTGLTCVGVVSTSVMAAKNTCTAWDILKEYDEEHPDASSKDRFLKVAPVYIPTALMGAATIACAIGAHTTNRAQTAAMASAYAIAQEAAARYRDKVVETIGEKKVKEIDNKVADELLQSNPQSNQPIMFGKGEVLCFDTLSSRYFMSDMETLRKVQNDLNKVILDDTWVSLNELYYRLGMDPMNLGENLGWSVDHLLEMKFSSRLDEHGTPCLVIDYESQPIADFYRRY